MTKRLRKRKVRVVLKSRNPNDSLNILQNVEDVFRPQDLEIIVDEAASSKSTDWSVQDEQLETTIREKAAEALDEKAEQRTEVKADSLKQTEASPDGVNKTVKQKIQSGISALWDVGWKIVVKLGIENVMH